ncbi:PREDICTED: uncharacterized protein LOC107063635 [Polistes dominula]|uniref:Uncharacterized protein LOC107063635 n=1 Tax=Polistes dominula TaxID=743375 RepID=A0ABM1HSU1_POLDO|nr:PREDICTED: uncharacterized protein LOC107063635 [Polistes dominula]
MKDYICNIGREDTEEDVCHFQELYKRKPCFKKSISHYHTYPNYASGDPYSRCEHSIMYDVNQQESYGRKKKSKTHRCPSCHCQLDFKRTPSKTRDIDNIEAVFKKTEHIFDNALANGGVKKSYSIPLSPKSNPRCHRTHSKKISNNNHRQKQRWNDDDDDKFKMMINDIVNKGVENEYYIKCPNNLPIKSSTKKDCHWKNDQVLQGILDYSEPESDSMDKYYEKYSRTKKCCDNSKRVELESNLKKKENEFEEYKQHLKQQYHELDQLKYHLYDKLKNIDDQQCKEDDSSNVEQPDRKKKSYIEDEMRKKNKEHRLNNELQCIDSSKKHQSLTSNNKTIPEQVNDKIVQQVEASTSYHCTDRETDVDVDNYLEDEKLIRELKKIPYLKPCHKSSSSVQKNEKCTKSFEKTTCIEKEINDKNDNTDIVVKSNNPDEDLDLHASKSHILNLIDKALSKEFGPLDAKKVFQMKIFGLFVINYRIRDPVKEEISRQELFIAISRALQGDSCDTLGQTLLSHRGTLDYVRHLKILRWEYLNHIQDKLKKLYDLEKILDNCSSPRNSMLTLQSHVDNTTDQYKHVRAQQEQQKELKTS